MKPVKLYYYKFKGSKYGNFGDELSPIIINRVFNKEVAHSNPFMCDLISLGSILDLFCFRGIRNRRDIKHLPNLIGTRAVWGSGFMHRQDYLFRSKLEVFAVRGKLSLAQLKDSKLDNIALGDPGLLVSYIIEKPQKKNYRVGIVPHYVEQQNPFIKHFLETVPHSLFIDVLAPPMEVLKNIASCEFILSSSLHGLITADSLNIPNQWLKLSVEVGGDGHKFSDYYSVFGIEAPLPILPEQVSADVMQAYIQNYKRDNIEQIKEKLLSAFPY